MQSSHFLEELLWKDLREGTSVAHFSSNKKSQQIYLKKINASKPSARPVTIFLFHDLASYHGRFMGLVNFFKTQHPEINFVMMDFLGHGLSSGTRGHINDFSDLANDAASVIMSLPKKENEIWMALGQGLGALSILDLINRFDDSVKGKIDKLVLSNFILNFHSPALSIQNKLLSNLLTLSDAMKTTRLLSIYHPEEMLTHAREQAHYLEDPLIVRKPTYQTFKCINSVVKTIHQSAYFLDKPTLLLESSSPYLIPNGMNSFSKGFKKGLMSEKKYSNLKHDLYNEKDNMKVFNDIAEWMNS